MVSDGVSENGPCAIGDWRIDPESNCITDGGTVLRLEPKAMRVLVHLAERAGRVVTRCRAGGGRVGRHGSRSRRSHQRHHQAPPCAR